MRNYKHTLLLFVFAGCFTASRAQIFSVGSSGMTISSGTVFSADSLMLTPSIDFTLSNVALNKEDELIHAAISPYIERVYRFSSITAAYQGTVSMHYLPSELNGIQTHDLRVSIHNGAVWQQFSSAVNNEAAHYVLSNFSPLVAMNEITLGSVFNLLPLTWLSFTAAKQNNTEEVLLQWSTGHEQNTLNFSVQHSTDGVRWNNLVIVPRDNSGNTVHSYNAVHASPAKGINYYRIQQNDVDGRRSFSDIRTVWLSAGNTSFNVLANPVTSNSLQVTVNGQMTLSLYTGEGKLIWNKNADPGIQNFDVTALAKGLYYLKGNNVTIKLLIQ